MSESLFTNQYLCIHVGQSLHFKWPLLRNCVCLESRLWSLHVLWILYATRTQRKPGAGYDVTRTRASRSADLGRRDVPLKIALESIFILQQWEEYLAAKRISVRNVFNISIKWQVVYLYKSSSNSMLEGTTRYISKILMKSQIYGEKKNSCVKIGTRYICTNQKKIVYQIFFSCQFFFPSISISTSSYFLSIKAHIYSSISSTVNVDSVISWKIVVSSGESKVHYCK